MIKRTIGSLLAAIGVMVAGSAMFLALAGPASAAGTGYAPAPAPTPTPTPSTTCGSGAIVTSADVGAAGGSITGTVGGSTVTVTVPAGALPSTGTQVALTDTAGTAAAPSGDTIVLSFAVNFCVNGSKFTGTFATPVTVTVSDPAIKPGQSLFVLTPSGLVPVSATIGNGSFTITITGDPTFVLVTSSTTATAIPGATSVVTGKPFVLEGAVAGALVLFGSFLLLRLRFRHR
jgi:hypothetical protein